MERTEPALVPEWLRCTGNVTGGGASVHTSDISSAHSTRNRSFRSNNEKESSHFLRRSSSSNSRHSSSSNGSAKHPYSSFSRSHWDRNRDREKEKSIAEDVWEDDSSDHLGSILTSRVAKNALRRSQSLVSRKTDEPSPRRIENKPSSGNGVLSRGNNFNAIQKSVFEKYFPSLGTEDKPGGSGIRRVSSPGLSSAVQSLPVGSSGFLGGERWTSALAEVPATVANNGSGFLGGERWTSALAEVPATVANNGTGHSHLQHHISTFPSSSSGISSNLNMAEALSQPAARVHANSQLPDKSRRLEELAIKQSRQLIPVTPSTPKPSVPGTADKLKQPKIALRTNEMNVAPKAFHTQPHPSHLTTQSRSGQIRTDSASNPHVGKFLVLKPGRESIASGAKDVTSPTGYANGKVAKDGQLPMASCTATGESSASNSIVSALENKTSALSLSSKSSMDKKSSQFLAQSRSEFFNLMRRKTSVRVSTNHSDSSLDVLSSSAEISAENCKEDNSAEDPSVLDNGNHTICNGDRYNITEKNECISDVVDSSLSHHVSIDPVEEETAFLRSLGWEENGGEDEGLTEEEINAFYKEYMKQRPSFDACQSSQPKSPTVPKFPNAISDMISDSSSSESEPET